MGNTFVKLVKVMPNFLGIDYGAKRIGLALGAGDIRIARPLVTLENSGNLLAQIHQLCLQHQVESVVVGMPRNLDGQDTAQTREVQRFVDQLATVGLEVILQDEAVTSSLAAERVGRDGGKGDVDQEAAAIILQDFLNEH